MTLINDWNVQAKIKQERQSRMQVILFRNTKLDCRSWLCIHPACYNLCLAFLANLILVTDDRDRTGQLPKS